VREQCERVVDVELDRLRQLVGDHEPSAAPR
jgi:hypothetical protein